MKYVLTKASDDNFMEIVDYDLEQINALALSKGIVITPNYFFNENDINIKPEMFGRIGSLDVGKCADFLLLDDELNVKAVFIDGKPAFGQLE